MMDATQRAAGIVFLVESIKSKIDSNTAVNPEYWDGGGNVSREDSVTSIQRLITTTRSELLTLSRELEEKRRWKKS